MYLNLGKRSKSTSVAPRRVTVQETRAQNSPTPPPAKPVAEPPPQLSPYSFFFPIPLTSRGIKIGIGSPRGITGAAAPSLASAPIPAALPAVEAAQQERVEFRMRRKQYLEEHASAFEPYHSSNLSVVHKAFVQVINDEGMLTRASFNEALRSLGVQDDSLIDRIFDLFDTRKDGVIEYKEVVQALDVILNGTNKKITCKDCFDLFDPSGCGYLIKPCLTELKVNQQEKDGINHLMVKTLIEIIDRLQAEDFEKFQKEWAKHNRKPRPRSKSTSATNRPEKPATATRPSDKALAATEAPKKKKKLEPTRFARKIHLSSDEFRECLAKDPVLVQAFLGRVLLTMESVYLRNKRTLQGGALSVSSVGSTHRE
eukprot:TRINITY_DN11996_c0_g1_i1.p1 TRINITY_DN11996_c0_g1~~TRINITY_DN11996_c0_g1_i1.p1  ORF type:complete len:370 (+),score=61.23 TRINITY_DN11996_c0_g1_i1:65-1174(+)